MLVKVVNNKLLVKDSTKTTLPANKRSAVLATVKKGELVVKEGTVETIKQEDEQTR